ncbi:hypothetical protein H310_04482 [Aphanomyces invadans]|uniref:COMM domain-containing protein n=1 Tax=Aphanomyces invadans TaxID=157072 RepID=A0A024UDZ5_9STRA|nr:hypothetical protein H310_04482 [Aphanomyces invadans]ETW04122.1 hypothetical protein H310_04482 [Aphanomyces invadans]|eukprot:XP_008867078.1 hypothetical protein H310_04482 [Aphanomyces invadans]
MNAFPTDKLALLLRRILQSPDTSTCVFSDQEQSQLMVMGNMSAPQVTVLLAGVTRIVSSAAYHDWDDKQFVSEVSRLGVLEATSSALGAVWGQEKLTYREALLHKSTMSGQLPSITDSHWRMHVTIADSVSTGHAIPHALFHLHTVKSHLSSSPSNDDNEIHMEMNHTDLYDFFIQLDAIQSEIDALATPP